MSEFHRVCVAGGCVIAPVAHQVGRIVRIELDPQTVLGRERGRRLDPLSQLALVAVERARQHAGLGAGDPQDKLMREGVTVGSALGSTTTTVRYARRLVAAGPAMTNPIDFPDSIDGAPAAHVALDLGLGGPSLTFVDGPSSATSALVHAARQISRGRATRMHVVVGDKFDALFGEAMANDPEFSGAANGVGYCPAECVVALVLEAYDLRRAPAPLPEQPVELVGFLEMGPREPDRASDGWAAPLVWMLEPCGVVRAAREATPGCRCLKNPSGAFELAGAWLGAIGPVGSLTGAGEPAVPAAIAHRVHCGRPRYPHLGFVRSRGQ